MTPAIRHLKQQKLPHQVHAYEHDARVASYGLEAAEKLGVPAERVFKTLVVQADKGELLVALVPVAGSLDLKKLASSAGVKKVVMADPLLVSRSTGYVLGGVSPLGQKKKLRTFIDLTASHWPSLFVSAGRRGLEIELEAKVLQQETSAVLAAIGA